MTDTTDQGAQYALMALMGKVGASVSELATLIAKAQGESSKVTDGLDAIEGALADVAEGLQNPGVEQALKELVKALAGMNQKPPVVNVEVNPTPITVEAVMPPSPAPIIHVMPAKEQGEQSWQVSVVGRQGEPPRLMTITRLS